MRAAPKENIQEFAFVDRSAVQFTHDLVVLSSGVTRFLPLTAKPDRGRAERLELLAAAYRAGNLKVNCRDLSRFVIARGFERRTDYDATTSG